MFSASTKASSEAWERRVSAALRRMEARCMGGVVRQVWNAACAASTAASTSAALAWGILSTTWPFPGLRVSRKSEPFESCHVPL